MHRILASLLFAFSLSSTASAEPWLDGRVMGLAVGDSETVALEKLGDDCSGIERRVVSPPSHPSAESSEVHLVCSGVAINDRPVDVLVLTFGDDSLSMAFAEGGATAAFKSMFSEELMTYLQFSGSFEDRLIMNDVEDQAWLLSPETAHANLFMWANPYVETSDAPGYRSSAARPDLLAFGEHLDSLQPEFEAQCDFTRVDEYRVWLLTEPDVQQQLDCFGFEYAGYPRKIEAVFGDGILEQVWILTGKAEEDRVRQALIEAYGEPSFVDEMWEIFDDGLVMLRKDKPEVLMVSERLAPLYRAEYIDP